jgi:pseudaminic acid biosynthesis-associated methylase
MTVRVFNIHGTPIVPEDMDLCSASVPSSQELDGAAYYPGSDEYARILKAVSIESGLDLWSGEFGNDYLKRNFVKWRNRIPFWSGIVPRTGARSFFEMGCSAGWNLSAILETMPNANVCGNDINTLACEQARQAGLNVVNLLDFDVACPGRYELVFTAGVLIHIEPEHLDEVMRALIAKSYRWVLAIEYAADVETQVEYRGHTEKCWKRPYGALYEALGLKLVDSGDAGAGFDRCTYWLLER